MVVVVGTIVGGVDVVDGDELTNRLLEHAANKRISTKRNRRTGLGRYLPRSSQTSGLPLRMFDGSEKSVVVNFAQRGREYRIAIPRARRRPSRGSRPKQKHGRRNRLRRGVNELVERTDVNEA